MTHPCSRRMFLLGSATTLAGVVLAACGGDASKAKEIAVREVPVGSAVIVGDFILTQPTAGEYKAYSAVCTHQRAKITKVDGSHVICPAHGSIFDITDGSVVSGLARDPLKTATVNVAGDTATITS
ncbi:Rieske (2Fe-2S) protein [Corynebacterium rouxii]|nr:Rieske (2Fe-2S) protein [Corynebacterium rouxii]